MTKNILTPGIITQHGLKLKLRFEILSSFVRIESVSYCILLQIQMSHKVLSSDMASLVQAMKLAQEYSTTLLDGEYRKGMLQAAHVLAVDAKHLLDTVEGARKGQPIGTNSGTDKQTGGGDGKQHSRNLSSSSQAGFLSSGAPPLNTDSSSSS